MGVNEFTNAEKYKGNDIDTDGDGSVNDAQTVQGNAPSDLGNTIDNKTITRNDNNELQNEKIINTIGDFETGLGVWTINNTDLSSCQRINDSSNSYNGNYSIVFDTYNGTAGEIGRSFDFTDYEELRFWVRVEAKDDTDTAEVQLDGTQVWKVNNNDPTGSFFEVVVDVSSYGSNTSLDLIANGNGNTANLYIFFDYFRAVKPNKILTNKRSGAGGTV